MPDPLTIGTAAIKYGPAVFGTLKGLFGGKSKEQKMREQSLARIQKIADQGLDRGVLDRAVSILNQRIGGEQQGALSRLAAGGLSPSSGLAQEAAASIRRSRGIREGEARSAFDEMSQRAQMEANQYLAGLPVEDDSSLSESLTSLGTSLYEDFSEGGLFNRKRKKLLPPTAQNVGQYVRQRDYGYQPVTIP